MRAKQIPEHAIANSLGLLNAFQKNRVSTKASNAHTNTHIAVHSKLLLGYESILREM